MYSIKIRPVSHFLLTYHSCFTKEDNGKMHTFDNRIITQLYGSFICNQICIFSEQINQKTNKIKV